jgi:LmbE family N-acetylglucosaminyl deacetylase
MAVGQHAWSRVSRRARRLDTQAIRSLSPVLILAPHQDDETLGCGALIAAAARMGLRPRVAFLTDGSASHEGSPTWSAQRLAAARRAEALDALGVLGVPPADILFLDWPDAAPPPPGSPRYRAALDRLGGWAAGFRPRGLLSPWRGEDHCDHEAAARLAADLARTLRPPLKTLDYLVWGWAQRDLPPALGRATVWGLPCRDTTLLRRRALACHATQTSDLIDDARQSFRVPARLAALTARPMEIYLEHA